VPASQLLPPTANQPPQTKSVKRRSRLGLVWLVLLASMLGLLCGPSWAQTSTTNTPLRIASAFDPQTMDPHGVALLYHSRVVFQLYESLVSRDEKFVLEPALASSWQNTSPTTWRFQLREAVKFHDGSVFSADDAVFSLERALAPTSQRSFQLKGVVAIKKTGPLQIEIQLEAPDAVLPDKLQYIVMMNKAWCEKNNVVKPQDFNAKQETFAVRNANGTGPYQLDKFEPDARVLLTRHPAWWGGTQARFAKPVGRVDQVSFITIRSDATRLAALQSGEVDMVLDPPFQDISRLQSDPRLSLVKSADMGQQYLTFDQSRDELPGSDVKGRNPFKDLRVRQAVYHAINLPLIIDKVLRGHATPAGALLPTSVNGVPTELDQRLPYDPAKSKALLAAAGYPNGFSVPMDCVNVSWREAVCQAVAAMLTQVGIKASLRSSPTSQFFPKLTQATIGLAEFGWNSTPDPWNSLNALFRTHGAGGQGSFNAGRYSNPALDVLIDAVRVEPDITRRRARVAAVMRMLSDDLPLVPLYRRNLTWVMKKNINVVIWPNDLIELRFVRIVNSAATK
jgi:peptide/nickel transport system substrate-binding protein